MKKYTFVLFALVFLLNIYIYDDHNVENYDTKDKVVEVNGRGLDRPDAGC